MKKVFTIVIIILLFVGCNKNKEGNNLKNSNSSKELIELNAKDLLGNSKIYFDKYQIEESKKELLILLKKFPTSNEVVEAKKILKLANLELEKIKIKEDSIKKAERLRKEEEKKKKALWVKEKTKHLRKKIDKLEGVTWYQDRSSPQHINYNGFYLYIGDTGNGYPNLRLNIQYKGDSWLFIEKYVIYVDGLKYKTIEPEYGDVKRDNGYGGVWEWIDLPISKYNRNDDIIDDISLLRIISTSKDVKIKFIGSKYSKTKTITNKQKRAIKNMLDAYVVLGGKMY